MPNEGVNTDLPDVSTAKNEIISEKIDDLEKQLLNQTHARASERFFFIATLLVIYDAHTFKSFSGWAPPVCLTLLEIGGLYVLAEMTGVRNIASLIRTGITNVSSKVGGHGGSE